NVRKADKAHGDDLSLTRWVKEPGRHAKPPRTGLAAADATGTRFPTRVLPVAAMSAILVSGHSNVKIGRDVRKGKLKGYWIYTLSLEERATCPTSCEHWRSCYGNAMPFAKRVDHTDPAFLPALADFFALDPNDRNGLRLAARDLNSDGKAEVIVAGGGTANPVLRTFSFPNYTTPAQSVDPFRDPYLLDGLYIG
ncbi:MAG: hypothetical protein K2P78_14230, partial [Gemmataceae bacterium]|nr:hypothetical protein [Gemmataceae bacterium]